MLARHGLRLRTDVLSDGGRSLYRDVSPPAPGADRNGEASTADVLRETDEVLDRLDAVLDRVRARTA
jgi:hypothetical protein